MSLDTWYRSLEKWFRTVVVPYTDATLPQIQLNILKGFQYGEGSIYDFVRDWRKPEFNSKEELMNIIRARDFQLDQGGETNYKLLHQSVKRLIKLGYVERVPGTFARRAIHYKLTEKGIFYLLHHKEMDIGWYYSRIELENNTPLAFQALLHPFFEIKTVREMGRDLSLLLSEYLQQCCNLALNIRTEFTMNGVWKYADMPMLYERLHMLAIGNAVTIATHDGLFVKPDDLSDSPSPIVKQVRDMVQEERENRLRTLHRLSEDTRFMTHLDMVYLRLNKRYELLMKFRRETR